MNENSIIFIIINWVRLNFIFDVSEAISQVMLIIEKCLS